MADLIDRAALLSELEERYENHKKRSRRNVGAGFVEYHKEWAAMATGIEECLAVVKNHPAVDAVVHARWEANQYAYGFDVCSACHDCNIWGEWADGKKWNYCPNCGAKMQGG